MTVPDEPQKPGLLGELIHPEGTLLPRISGVFRLDPKIYEDIAGDPYCIPQAVAVVLLTALVVGIGSASLAGLFIGVAWALATWFLVALILWAAATLVLGGHHHYAALLRCLGFSYAWFALFVGYELPFVGWLFGWAAVGFCALSSVLATRAVFEVSTRRAAAVCITALAVPLILLALIF